MKAMSVVKRFNIRPVVYEKRYYYIFIKLNCMIHIPTGFVSKKEIGQRITRRNILQRNDKYKKKNKISYLL